MKPLALPKSLLLRKPWEYRKVYEGGQRVRGARLTLIHLANGGADNRLGISIHGVKSAVRRNRIKRIIREYFRLNRDFLQPAADVVFAVRDGFKPDTLGEVRELLERMLRGAGPARVQERSLAAPAFSGPGSGADPEQMPIQPAKMTQQ